MAETFTPGAEEVGQKHTADRTAATILLIVSGVICLFLAFAGLMLIMSTDGCGSGSNDGCDYSLFTISWIATMAIPVVGFVAILVTTIVRWARDLSAWWIPVAGTLGAFAMWVGAVALAFHALN